MKVLVDQCTPEELREKLPEHDIQTADEAGMGEVGNGDLIDEAVRRGYDLLLTADRRMQKQQDIEGKPLRVVVLTRPDVAKATKQINEIREAIATAKPGQFTRVIAPRTQPQRQVTFEARGDGLFNITERVGSRGRSRTLRSGVTIPAGLEWVADAELIAKDEITPARPAAVIHFSSLPRRSLRVCEEMGRPSIVPFTWSPSKREERSAFGQRELHR